MSNVPAFTINHSIVLVVIFFNCFRSKLGITNSLTPPCVNPPPINPALVLLIGEAIPNGVSNSIMPKGPLIKFPVSSSNVNFLARSEEFVIFIISSAAHVGKEKKINDYLWSLTQSFL